MNRPDSRRRGGPIRLATGPRAPAAAVVAARAPRCEPSVVAQVSNPSASSCSTLRNGPVTSKVTPFAPPFADGPRWELK